MSRERFELSVRSACRQIVAWIDFFAKLGLLLSRDFESIRQAVIFNRGHYLLDLVGENITCYAETVEYIGCIVLRSVLVIPKFQKKGLMRKIVGIAIDSAKKRQPKVPVILACHPHLIERYEKLSFRLQPKELAPAEVRGGRDESEWIASDREWMILDIEDYLRRKEKVNDQTKCVH